MGKRVGIVGSRTFPDMELVRQFVRSLPPGTVVVSGTEPPPEHVKRNRSDGVDETAIREARRIGLRTMVFTPNVAAFGVPRAMFVRNGQIVKYSDEIHAFWDGWSTGTADTIEKARLKGNLAEVVELPF